MGSERVQRGRGDGGGVNRGRRSALGALLALAAAGAVGLAVRSSQALPAGPEPVAWDRAACAHCHMHVGEPHFAAQLQTDEGEVLNFDDPGCLFRFVRERAPHVHAMYFHDGRGDRWLSRNDAAFVPAGRTPMGYGLMAVGRGEPGALTYEQAAARLAQPSGSAGGAP